MLLGTKKPFLKVKLTNVVQNEKQMQPKFDQNTIGINAAKAKVLEKLLESSNDNKSAGN